MGVEFTVYTSFSAFQNESSCQTRSAEISLTTPFFVPTPTPAIEDFFYYVAETPFVYGLNPGCSVSQFDLLDGSSLKSLVSTLPLSRPKTSSTLSSSSSPLSAVPSPPTATATLSSPSHSPQTSSVGSTETRKLIVGLVVAILAPIILVTIGLSTLYIIRRRRRRKEEAAISSQDVGKDEGGNPQLYFQQKVELDDEQRRHDMEAVEIRYEMEGEDEIHELPVEERQRRSGRQELRGEEHAREIDDSQ